ncbi:AraC family transcriptional regulator [Rubritalea tangerina]
MVRASESDSREWLEEAPVCQALGKYNILHAAVIKAGEGLKVSRVEQSGTFMMACLEGEGQVLADGRWQTIRVGQACLLPPFVTNAFKKIEGKPWRFCWVRYIESKESNPIVSEISPVVGSFHGWSLARAIQGLIEETESVGGQAATHHWIELMHGYVMSFAQPHQSDNRLWKLWNVVEQNLEQDWTLQSLSQLACLSEEHLRRLCKKQLGRSPVQHLTFLRMQKACSLLATTEDKIEVIAKAVGYRSAFHFSNVFSKWVGCRPSEHRKASY